ncbi:beta-glucuronosyltransferase GlcAT14A [Dendrobium catenatum]|uniref:beta-glucuronosyltransferase GlcAT14A n=1 Tax=Dendrobium catenatum TaxID=906689 RepID=UPI0010A05E83|nr:beta-glucuronosyltransferase GlcAT14A [Dendrobium catenatum]
MEFKKGRVVSLLPSGMEKKWALPLFLISFFAVFLVTSLNMGLLSSVSTIDSVLSFLPSKFSGDRSAIVLESKLSPAPATNVPRLAYLISGSKGNLNQLWRTLHALYHPHNLYVVHLDLESSVAERRELVARVANHSLFAKVENVHVIKKANMVTYRGPTMMATTLHACAILLKKKKHWDWFINLSASDYPLVTHDLLFTFSKLPRNLNFIEHTSRLGWKEDQRAKPLIVDPGLYMKSKSNVFWLSPRRESPNAFKLFTGSAWMALSRDFVEFCIYGWDNLPRTLLMYYTNFISSSESYFQTVICNVPEFNNTVINHDLHYISWDYPPQQHPHILGLPDLERMISSKAPFARKFKMNDSVLHKIDEEFLGRRGEEGIVPGGWCSGEPRCSDIGDEMRLEPGPGSQRLTQLMDRLVRSNNFKMNQCR